MPNLHMSFYCAILISPPKSFLIIYEYKQSISVVKTSAISCSVYFVHFVYFILIYIAYLVLGFLWRVSW